MGLPNFLGWEDLLSYGAPQARARKQRVRYEVSISGILPIEHGVPQGSILGPIVFTIYMDDLVDEISNSQTKMYADHCQLFFKFKVSDSANAISALTISR